MQHGTDKGNLLARLHFGDSVCIEFKISLVQFE